MNEKNYSTYLTHYRPAIPFKNGKFYFRGSFSVLSQLKKHHTSGNLKFNYLGIFQRLKLRILKEKNRFHFSLAKFHSKYLRLLWVKYLIRMSERMRFSALTDVSSLDLSHYSVTS